MPSAADQALLAHFSWSTRPVPKHWVHVEMEAPIDPNDDLPETTYSGPAAAIRLYRMALSFGSGLLGTAEARTLARQKAEHPPDFGAAPADLTVEQSRPTRDRMRHVLFLPAEPAHLWRTRLMGNAAGKEAAQRRMLFLDTFVRTAERSYIVHRLRSDEEN